MECYVINNRYSYSLTYPGREADQVEAFYAGLYRETRRQTRLARRMLYSLCVCFLRCGLPKETVNQLYRTAEESDYRRLRN